MVRAVLLGDPEVGKSSIIKCYISNNFDDNIAAVIPVAVLPPEASPEGVPLTLVDTSARDVEVLEDEVGRADVAVVVYAADRPDTLARVGSYWLPRLRELRGDIPVIVVGNKLDLRSGDAQAIESELRSAAAPIMEIFRQVETLMDCSAKKMINVSELMLFATKAVLHPTAPLYDTGTHELKPACVRALTRIFALCDADRDGVLSDAELNKFQREVFGSPLVGVQMTGIKNLLRRNVSDGITDAGITVSGFIYLHKLFIQRGRSETTWEVLRGFYYGPNLGILRERLPSLSHLAPDQSCQLTPEAISFLTSLFWQHDKEGNGSLSPAQLKALFSDKTPGILWEGCGWQARQDGSGHLDLRGFLSLWTAACHLRTLQCIEYLVYLGYAGGNLAAADSAIKVCASRATDYKRRVTSRTVFEVLLCCARGVDAAEVALGMLTRQRPAALSAPLPSTASPSDEGGGAAGNLLVDLLVVDAVHTSRAAAGGAPGKAGRSEPGPDAASPLSPPPPVHLLVRPVSLEEGQLLLQGERDLVDEGGSAHDAGAPRHRVARKARHCIDAVVLAFDAADPASARACVGVREQMEKDELRMPCLMAGVAHLPPWSPDLSRHAQPAPATPALPATPATPAPVDASLNASVASLPAAAAGGGGSGGGGEGGPGSGPDDALASVALFCSQAGLMAPIVCGGSTPEGYARLYATAADVCQRPRDSSPLLLKESASALREGIVSGVLVLSLLAGAAMVYHRRYSR